MVNNKSLCLSLVKAETEDTVIEILKRNGYWDDSNVWRNFGDNENNFSTIGNQQTRADTALVEKIINSVDAVLLSEVLKKGIDPQGESAPQNSLETLQDFFGIKDGKLVNLGISDRSDLAKNIKLVATGKKRHPNYIIADQGEGQTPGNMPNTFLSINRSNKLQIPFVQGRFNMGGTGSLQFCGHNKLQLIVTRRNPELAASTQADNDWGFTVIRREDPKKGVRNSVFRYLCPNGQIPSFSSDLLNILPGDYPKPYEQPMEYGSFVKLFNYDLRGLKTNILFDLYNRLSALLPNIALPVTMYERRSGYSGHSYETILSGLNVRLDEDRSNNLEDNFPSSSEINVNGEKLLVSIYVFKKGRRRNYTQNDGVLFTHNGQTHGFISKSFFEKKQVNMSYLADSILVLIDCSKITGRAREDMFMNSRDRLREGLLLSSIEKEVATILNGHPGLKALSEKRRREEISENLADSKPLAETLEKIIKQSPSLSSLFDLGVRINNPFDLRDGGETDEFKGKKYPTFFKLSKKVKSPTSRPANNSFRIPFETDAENEYFMREEDPGSVGVLINGKEVQNYSCNLWNGKATLNLRFPEDTVPGEKFEYKVAVDGARQLDSFENQFTILAAKPVKARGGGNGGRGKPPSHGKGGKRERPSALALPHVEQVSRDGWEAQEFDQYSALAVKKHDEQYDFFVNIDNSYLLNEIKVNSKLDAEIIRARFVNALVLISLALLKEYEKSNKDALEVESPSARVAETTKAIAPVICPIIDKLGNL